ncbi:Uncharacterized conserved protein [Plasmopara halstedii]|uniref:Uncharacterized conserved protein n=1 Tax=Plasmopara halstedii TaxID=4781 RepID=A0A0P1A902_PLAHL|nr:Uncharacterized conserved protein [Plasmopara halstedii]CEG36647.1 Uncharacterized conserved protein [Plasmopara halstedii]|eukprot:XP_024573016.1 Uncharacterized conserved protein [Plasmopara halstedii]
MTTTQRVRAADQGPLDWLVPFIPPAFRVNRDTRADIRRKAAQLTSRETLKSFVLALRPHWRFLTLSSFAVVIWIKGLVYIHKHEPEFAVAYIIVSGFFLLAYHLFIGGEVRTDDISAYSVFNRGAQRMMGSLSAEQFENELRHRQLPHEDASTSNRRSEAAQKHDYCDEANNDDDQELMVALAHSLQEMKREARRARRTSRKK